MIKSTGHKPYQTILAEMHHHKLSPTICDYEQLISIGYKYNQLENDNVS